MVRKDVSSLEGIKLKKIKVLFEISLPFSRENYLSKNWKRWSIFNQDAIQFKCFDFISKITSSIYPGDFVTLSLGYPLSHSLTLSLYLFCATPFPTHLLFLPLSGYSFYLLLFIELNLFIDILNKIFLGRFFPSYFNGMSLADDQLPLNLGKDKSRNLEPIITIIGTNNKKVCWGFHKCLISVQYRYQSSIDISP